MYTIIYTIEEDEDLHKKWVFSFFRADVAKVCENLEEECKQNGRTLRKIVDIKPFGIF
jgi:hypothetical protein